MSKKYIYKMYAGTLYIKKSDLNDFYEGYYERIGMTRENVPFF